MKPEILSAMDSFVRDREMPSEIDDRFDFGGWVDENANEFAMMVNDEARETAGYIRVLLIGTSAAIMFGLIAWAVS